ncbi:unnamed protein product [Prunus armeniaca]
MDADPTKYIVTLKYSVPVSSSVCKHIRVEDSDDVQYFLKYNTNVMASKVTPLVASLKNIKGHGIEGCNGIVSIESSNALANFVVEQRNVVIWDNETENGGNDLNWSDWVEEVNFEGGENIVADFNEPSIEEESHSAPIVHPHEDNNVNPPLCSVDSLAAIRDHFRLRTVQSGKRRLCVRCWQLPCPWKVRAYKVGLHEFKVVKYDPLHECDLRSVSSHHPQATTELLSNCVKWRFQDLRSIYTATDIKKDVEKNFGVSISYSTTWRSRELAFKRIKGSSEESYSLLPSYCYELERTNPGTLTYIETDAAEHFLYFLWQLVNAYEDFKSSMRPVIAVDATHLKCKYKAWEWFLRKLHCAIGDCSNLVVISYHNVSIQNGLRRVFPAASHGICFYHLKGNMKASFQLKQRDPILGYFVRAAKSYRLAEFNRHFSMTNNDRVRTYLLRAGVHKWMLPVLHLIDEITNLLLYWFRQRWDLAMKCRSTLCPDLGEKKLRKRLDAASKMNVVKINDVEYNVLDVCQHLKLNPYSFASSYYTRATWEAAYAESIYPVPPEGTWVIPENLKKVKIRPPLSKVMPGRRKTQRIASKGEESRKKKCSRCGVKGHYRNTCKQSVPLTNKQHVV